jgi:hypothetical protein
MTNLKLARKNGWPYEITELNWTLHFFRRRAGSDNRPHATNPFPFCFGGAALISPPTPPSPPPAAAMPVYSIRGVDVDFPFEAYDCQITYMDRVLQSLQQVTAQSLSPQTPSPASNPTLRRRRSHFFFGLRSDCIALSMYRVITRSSRVRRGRGRRSACSALRSRGGGPSGSFFGAGAGVGEAANHQEASSRGPLRPRCRRTPWLSMPPGRIASSGRSSRSSRPPATGQYHNVWSITFIRQSL